MNRALPSLHGGSLENTLAVPFKKNFRRLIYCVMTYIVDSAAESMSLTVTNMAFLKVKTNLRVFPKYNGLPAFCSG